MNGLEKYQLSFTTINCDGEVRNWNLTAEELRKEYYSETCDVPMLDDPVIRFSENGIDFVADTFADIVERYNIDYRDIRRRKYL